MNGEFQVGDTVICLVDNVHGHYKHIIYPVLDISSNGAGEQIIMTSEGTYAHHRWFALVSRKPPQEVTIENIDLW